MFLRGFLLLCTVAVTNQSYDKYTKSISCGAIKNEKGFKFKHAAGLMNGTFYYVFCNETVMATANLTTQKFESLDVPEMDNNSVTMKHCENIRVEIMIPDVKGLVKEYVIDFHAIPTKTTTPAPATDNTAPVPTNNTPWIALGITCVVAFILFVAFILSYNSWKKTHSQGTVREFAKYLWNRLRKQENGDDGGRGVDVEFGDVDSPDSNADDTAAAIDADHSLSNGRTPPTNEDIDVLTRNPAMNGSWRDDPVGVNGIKRNNVVRGGTVDHDAENQENDGLLQNGHIPATTNDQAMNGNLRNDPGEVNRNERNDLVRGGPDVEDGSTGGLLPRVLTWFQPKTKNHEEP